MCENYAVVQSIDCIRFSSFSIFINDEIFFKCKLIVKKILINIYYFIVKIWHIQIQKINKSLCSFRLELDHWFFNLFWIYLFWNPIDNSLWNAKYSSSDNLNFWVLYILRVTSQLSKFINQPTKYQTMANQIINKFKENENFALDSSWLYNNCGNIHHQSARRIQLTS